MKIVQAPSLTSLHVKLCDGMLLAGPDDLDMVSSVDVYQTDVLATTDSMGWSLDLKTLWLTRSRWTTLVRQYLDHDRVSGWLEGCEKVWEQGRGVVLMRANEVAVRDRQAKPSRRWGGCMVAWSFRPVPEPHLSMFSRTSYLGYIGALDLTVAHALAQEIAQRLELSVEDFSFTWHLDVAQFHGFKSVAWVLHHPILPDLRKTLLAARLTSGDRRRIEGRPAVRLARRWLDDVRKQDREGVLYADVKYGAYRRIRRRYHTEVKGLEYARRFEGRGVRAYDPLPSLDAASLDLSPLRGRR